MTCRRSTRRPAKVGWPRPSVPNCRHAMQTIIVITVLAACAAYIVRRLLHTLRGGGHPCGTCPLKEKCETKCKKQH
ncbi:MAG: FeoB-associated Cys-rich membrane protein [Prevotella sp.]